jgi:hypothetical protein
MLLLPVFFIFIRFLKEVGHDDSVLYFLKQHVHVHSLTNGNHLHFQSKLGKFLFEKSCIHATFLRIKTDIIHTVQHKNINFIESGTPFENQY